MSKVFNPIDIAKSTPFRGRYTVPSLNFRYASLNYTFDLKLVKTSVTFSKFHDEDTNWEGGSVAIGLNPNLNAILKKLKKIPYVDKAVNKIEGLSQDVVDLVTEKFPIIKKINDYLATLPVDFNLGIPQVIIQYRKETDEYHLQIKSTFKAELGAAKAFDNLLKNTTGDSFLNDKVKLNLSGARTCAVTVPLSRLEMSDIVDVPAAFAVTCGQTMLTDFKQTGDTRSYMESLSHWLKPGWVLNGGAISEDTAGVDIGVAGYDQKTSQHYMAAVRYDENNQYILGDYKVGVGTNGSASVGMVFSTDVGVLDFPWFNRFENIYVGGEYGDTMNAMQFEETAMSLIWYFKAHNESVSDPDLRLTEAQLQNAINNEFRAYKAYYDNPDTQKQTFFDMPEIFQRSKIYVDQAVVKADIDNTHAPDVDATIKTWDAIEYIVSRSPLDHSASLARMPVTTIAKKSNSDVVEVLTDYTVNDPDSFTSGTFNELLADDLTSTPLDPGRNPFTSGDFPSMLVDDMGMPPQEFEPTGAIQFKIPEEFTLYDKDGNVVTDQGVYTFVVQDDGSVEVANFELLPQYQLAPNQLPLGSDYNELEAKYGPNVAMMFYSAAISQYIEERETYNTTQQSATVPDLKETDKPVSQVVVDGGVMVLTRHAGPNGVSYSKDFYQNVTDPAKATTRIRIAPLKDLGKNSRIERVEEKVNGEWSLVTTQEYRNYGNLTLVKSTPADDPDHYSLDVTRSQESLFGEPVPIGTVGAALGSAIGGVVAGDDLFKQLTVSPLIETLGQNLFQGIGVGMLASDNDLSDDVLDVFNNFGSELGINMRDAAGGVVSSLITAEVIRAIDAEGLGAELASTVTNAVLSQISKNIITIGLNEITAGATVDVLGNPSGIFSGLENLDALGNTLGNAVGGFVGSKLAEEALAGYDSEEEAIGAQIGGALASAATLFAIGSVAGPVGWLLAGLASFAGNFLGGTVGDLIHTALPDKASTQLKFNSETGEFEIGRVWSKRDGNVKGVKALADVASDAMENVLGLLGGDVVNSDEFSGVFVWKESKNLHGPGYFEKGTYFENVGGYGLWHNSVDDFNAVVEGGVIDMLSRLEIAGGDLYAKRALYNSLPQLLDEHGKPIDDPLRVLAGNLQIAKEYKAYLDNKIIINALIQTQPDSVFAAGWMATLARAAELGLNQRHVSDIFGGWRYLIDKAMANAALSTLGYNGKERQIGLYDAQSGINLGDNVDPASKTVIVGSGVIDLRESTRELLSDLRKDGDLLIKSQGVELPEAYKDLRQEGNEIWLGDRQIATLGSSGVSSWNGRLNIDLLIYVSELAKDLAKGRKQQVDGLLYDIIAEIAEDGTLIPINENVALEGAMLQGDELIREGSTIASLDAEGVFTPTHGENIPIAAIVYGSEEDDIIYSGDKGNDIFAGDGNDIVYGGANADWMYGGEGDDILHAGDADGNALFGEAGDDALYGGDGSDWLEGGMGDDRLYGGDGCDVLQGNAGSDYLEGGLGGDNYVIRRGDGDNVIADNGAASTATDSSDPIFRVLGQVVQVTNGSVQGQESEDDRLSFGPQITFDDLTYERNDDDLLVHISGTDDTQETLTLSDWFTDAGRIETLEFADGIQIPIAKIEQFINGTTEDDQFTFADMDGPALINAMAGDDTIDLRDATPDTQAPTNPPFPWIFGTVLPIVSQPNTDAGYVLNGGEGNDSLYGSFSNDVLLGGSGDDVMEAGDGEDVLLGGENQDDLMGGAGDDILMGGEGDDQLDGGAGSDYLIGGVGDDQLNGGAGSDNYTFGYGDGQDSLNDAHIYEPEDAKLTTLLASLDSLIADMQDDNDGSDLGTVLPISGVLIIPAPGELETNRLLALMRDLKPIVESATGSRSKNLAKALSFLSDELEQNKMRIDQAALDRFAQEFRYLVLDAAGLLDVVDWTEGVEVGDITVGWEGDDLLLQLQSEFSEDTAAPDSLRLQEWASTAPYIERFDFDQGQVSISDIEQWIGGSDGADQLEGSEGNDWITGGIGNDMISAGAGDDILNGNVGEDQLQAGDGDDLLNGGSGNDQLFGGSGDDILNGNSGDDLLTGGAGADVMDGGIGVDMVSYADATAGVRVYLDNGDTLKIERGLSGEVHEVLQDADSSADRDALIKQLLEALPDPDGLIGEVADRVPLIEKLKTTFTEVITEGQRENAVALLQSIFDGSSELLQPDERTSLLETIQFVTQEPLPDSAGMDAFWEQVVSGLPERGALIERISEQLPSRSEQGERLAELITSGDRAGLISVINSWLRSLYGDEAPAKAEAILALIPDELPAIRGSIENLAAANEAIETTEPLFSFTSSGLNYGGEEEEATLGSFLGSDDGAALAEERSLTPFDDLAVKLDGYIYLDAGKHDFTVTADGGFALKIGGMEFSAATSKEVSADFAAGFYRFELTYFEHKGEEELKVTSNSLADGNPLDASFFYTDPMQIDPRLSEQTDDIGRTYLCYPATDEQGDYFENVEGVIGSAHDDLLWGDSSDNQLIGGEGADILHGAGGNDDLQGGAGDDRYEFGFGDGQDRVQDSAGDDSLMLGEDIAPEHLWFSREGDDLVLSIIGTTDRLTIEDWYSDTSSHLESITTASGETLLENQIESLVAAMSAFSPPQMGDATFGLAPDDRDSLSGAIATSWQ